MDLKIQPIWDCITPTADAGGNKLSKVSCTQILSALKPVWICIRGWLKVLTLQAVPPHSIKVSKPTIRAHLTVVFSANWWSSRWNDIDVASSKIRHLNALHRLRSLVAPLINGMPRKDVEKKRWDRITVQFFKDFPLQRSITTQSNLPTSVPNPYPQPQLRNLCSRVGTSMEFNPRFIYTRFIYSQLHTEYNNSTRWSWLANRKVILVWHNRYITNSWWCKDLRIHWKFWTIPYWPIPIWQPCSAELLSPDNRSM